MNTPIYADTSLADAFEKAGLDIRNPEDVRLFQEAALAVNRQGKTVTSVALKVAKDKTATEALNEHFSDFRSAERAKNPIPQPQPKEAKDQTATEGLDQYFAELRTKIKKEG